MGRIEGNKICLEIFGPLFYFGSSYSFYVLFVSKYNCWIIRDLEYDTYSRKLGAHADKIVQKRCVKFWTFWTEFAKQLPYVFAMH